MTSTPVHSLPLPMWGGSVHPIVAGREIYFLTVTHFGIAWATEHQMHGAGESALVLQLHVLSGRQAFVRYRLPCLEHNTDHHDEVDETRSVHGSRIEVALTLLHAAFVHRI